MGMEPNEPKQSPYLSAKRTEPNEPELFDSPNRTRTELSAQWASCKNSARNARETDVSEVQYVTYRPYHTVYLQCFVHYLWKCLWRTGTLIIKGTRFLELFTNENAIVTKSNWAQT